MTLQQGDMNPQMGPGGAAGSYSVSDQGASGDRYLVSPQAYPVPGYLRTYDSLRKALRVGVDACVLQYGGRCYVLKYDKARCGGQACNRGECYGELSGYESEQPVGMPDPVRREVAASWQPVAAVTSEGVALVKEGCTLPLFARVWYVGDQNNQFKRTTAGITYAAAVEAARWVARVQGKPRVVGGSSSDGRIIPVVYAHPGGILRPVNRSYALQVDPLSTFEVRQAVAASRGASIMPFGM